MCLPSKSPCWFEKLGRVYYFTASKPLYPAETVHMDKSLKDNFSNANNSWATKTNSLGFLLVQMLHSQHQVQPELLDVLEKQDIFMAIPGFQQHAQSKAWDVKVPLGKLSHQMWSAS